MATTHLTVVPVSLGQRRYGALAVALRARVVAARQRAAG